jgi:hypothetical protein
MWQKLQWRDRSEGKKLAGRRADAARSAALACETPRM